MLLFLAIYTTICHPIYFLQCQLGTFVHAMDADGQVSYVANSLSVMYLENGPVFSQEMISTTIIPLQCRGMTEIAILFFNVPLNIYVVWGPAWLVCEWVKCLWHG